MKITQEGFAVLDNDLISDWVRSERKIDHDQNALPRILPLIKSGDVVVDCGAHIGTHALSYARKVGPRGFVHAFEPNPDAASCLHYNRAGAKLFNIIIYPMALGAGDDETAHIMIARDNAGSSNICAEGDVKVRIVRLDSLNLDRLDLFKLDCEGFEPMALHGAQATIESFRPIIICEINAGALGKYGYTAQDLMSQINHLGYSISNIYPGQPMDGPQFDVIARPI